MKIVVLGAGLSGMVAARELGANHEITVLEKEDFVGGLASSFERDSQYIPKFYHHAIASNNYTIAELDSFGLLETAQWQRIKMSIGISEKLYNIRNPIDLLTMPGASLWAKFRFGLFGLYSLFFMNPDKIPDNKNAKEYMYRCCGKEATDFFWWNLYGRNKFNIPLEQISAKQLVHRLNEKEVSDKFTFPPAGFEVMLDGIKGQLKQQGVDLRLNAAISNINLEQKRVQLSSGEVFEYDVLINSIPIPEFLEVTTGLPEDYKTGLKKLRYCPAVGMCFGTREFLKKGVYWMNFFGEHIHLVMQHSVLIDKYKEKVSWVIRYGGSEEDLDKSEDEIQQLYFSNLGKYFPDMEKNVDKILYGSDWPGIQSISTSIEAIQKLPLSEESIVKILYGNAARILGLT